MNWAIKIISKTLMTKVSHISWGGYDKGFYGNYLFYCSITLYGLIIEINFYIILNNFQ